MSGRTPERWLVRDLTADARLRPAAVNLKLTKLARDPFAFFRGTLPEYVRWVRPDLSGPLASSVGLVTGDLHLENFGTFRGSSGRICFDLNDFDEVTRGPLVIDLRRLAASAGLACLVAGDSPALARSSVEAVIDGLLHSRPDAPPKVQELVATSQTQPADATLRECTGLTAGSLQVTRADDAAPLHAGIARELRESVKRLALDPPQRLSFLDAGHRLAGNGSLGRRRYLVLVRTAGRGLTLLDYKEPRGSPWGQTRSLLGARGRAAQVERAGRALRRESENLLGTARVGSRFFQVKEHSPHGMKLAAVKLAASERRAYAAFAGCLLARAWAHARQPSEALLEELRGRGRVRLLAQVGADIDRTLEAYRSFMVSRERIEAQLGLVPRAA